MRLLRPLIAVLAAAAIGAPALAFAASGSAVSRAEGYAALLPGGTQGAVSADSTVTREGSTAVAGLRPAGGGSVGSVEVSVTALAGGASAGAEGTVSATGVSLLDGRVSIASLRMTATAGAGPDGPQGGLSRAEVGGLVVDGRPVAAGPGSRVEVPGIGALVLLEHVADGAGDVQANALRVEVSDPAAAAVIGQPFVIGHLSLSAQQRPAAPEPAPRAAAPAPTRTAPEAPAPRREPAAPRTESAPASPITAPAPLGLPRKEAPPVSLPAGRAYVFPVFGDVSFGDDYGAPRAGTGWHHGNDLFAPTGTPILAVAEGRLSRVGVNTLGGNRLWLTDDAGNEFYYAHLSAYAPASLEGARVRAGQVIGFVGNTGQALTTPPHLHFEVHPAGADSVDPYPYLVAWRGGAGIPLAFRQAAASPSPAPAVGAVLVDGSPEVDRPTRPDDGLASPAT